MERIYPLPGRVRDALVEPWCEDAEKAAAKKDEGNRDRLLRLYLGVRSYGIGAQCSLCNFPLSLNRMDSLSLSATQYAEAVAEGLAILHWDAGIDGRDVELVLGGSRAREEGNRSSVWVRVLDFNQCEGIGRDERGLEMAARAARAARAFWDNDPYFPRPDAAEKERGLWKFFREKYLEVSGRIFGDENEEVNGLPRLFVERVIEIGKGRNANGPSVAAGPPRGSLRCK